MDGKITTKNYFQKRILGTALSSVYSPELYPLGYIRNQKKWK
jgi:hypothetical protein